MVDETVQEQVDDLAPILTEARRKLNKHYKQLSGQMPYSGGDSPDAQSILREAIDTALAQRLAGIRKLIDEWPNRCETCAGNGYVDCRDSCNDCNRSGIANYWKIRKLLEGAE